MKVFVVFKSKLLLTIQFWLILVHLFCNFVIIATSPAAFWPHYRFKRLNKFMNDCHGRLFNSDFYVIECTDKIQTKKKKNK